MKQEIVLPKFKIPGQTSWFIRALWIVGGLVVIQGVVLGGVFLARQNARHAEQVRVAAAAAATARAVAEAQQQQKIAAARAAVLSGGAVRAADRSALTTSTNMARATSVPASKPAARPALGYGKGKPKGWRGARGAKAPKYASRAAYHAAAKRKAAANRLRAYGRPAARKSASGAKAKPASRGDAIDELLRKFK